MQELLTAQQAQQQLHQTDSQIVSLQQERTRLAARMAEIDTKLPMLNEQSTTLRNLLPALQRAEQAETRAKELDKELVQARMDTTPKYTPANPAKPAEKEAE